MDAETLRQRWPDVLEAVKNERRVAWILLNSASVDSLEGGVLTVAFTRAGEAKGFATSGHDQVLIGVLRSMLGLNVRVRAVAGTTAGPRGGTRSAPVNSAAPGADASGRAGSPARSGGAAGQDDSPEEPGTPSGRPGPTSESAGMAPGGSRAAAGGPGGRATAAGPGGSGGSGAAGGPGGHRAAAGGPGGASVGSSAGRTASSAAAARPVAEVPLPDGPPADDEEEWPDDAGPGGNRPGPTGMELIERQLGGTVIEEIEEP
jgi:DNA polymerase-3 subunit gamma/tau